MSLAWLKSKQCLQHCLDSQSSLKPPCNNKFHSEREPLARCEDKLRRFANDLGHLKALNFFKAESGHCHILDGVIPDSEDGHAKSAHEPARKETCWGRFLNPLVNTLHAFHFPMTAHIDLDYHLLTSYVAVLTWKAKLSILRSPATRNRHRDIPLSVSK